MTEVVEPERRPVLLPAASAGLLSVALCHRRYTGVRGAWQIWLRQRRHMPVFDAMNYRPEMRWQLLTQPRCFRNGALQIVIPGSPTFRDRRA